MQKEVGARQVQSQTLQAACGFQQHFRLQMLRQTVALRCPSRSLEGRGALIELAHGVAKVSLNHMQKRFRLKSEAAAMHKMDLIASSVSLLSGPWTFVPFSL